MTTADEQAILDLADGRCPTNCRELRWIRADGIFNVGWLARVVNLGVVQALDRRLTPEMVATMAADVMPLNQSDQVGAFANLTLAAPCLGYARPDGPSVLIDGLKRAKQSFASGHPDVPAKIIMLDDARKLGTSAEYRELWKMLEATEHHPVGARQKRNFDRTIVGLSDDREAETPGRGQPSFNDDQNILSDSATYHLVALIEVEFHIYETHPGSARFGHIRRGLTRPAWVEVFLSELNRSGRLPIAHNTSEVANQAGAAISRAAGVGNRAAYKRRCKADWRQMSPDALVVERDAALDICAAIMKAALRLRLRQTFSRTLVSRENDSRPDVQWRDVHAAVEGPDERRRIAFDRSRLGFDEQLMVTHRTGINMNNVYHDYTNWDPLFQAYAFAFHIERHRKAQADPCLVEAVVHRRAMDILGQSDALTFFWTGLFEQWQRVGLTDAKLLDIARTLNTFHDSKSNVYDGMDVVVV